MNIHCETKGPWSFTPRPRVNEFSHCYHGSWSFTLKPAICEISLWARVFLEFHFEARPGLHEVSVWGQGSMKLHSDTKGLWSFSIEHKGCVDKKNSFMYVIDGLGCAWRMSRTLKTLNCMTVTANFILIPPVAVILWLRSGDSFHLAVLELGWDQLIRSCKTGCHLS